MADEGAAPVADTTPPTPGAATVVPSVKEEQNEDEGAQLKVQEKKTCGQSCGAFFYEKETGKVLGRKGLSWLKITIFYIIFYLAIFGFFALLLMISFQFTNKTQPRLIGKSSLLNNNPGLGVRPTNPYKKDNGKSALIWYNRGNMTDIKFLIGQLTKIVEQETNKKNKDVKYVDCDISKKAGKDEVCRPYGDVADWGECTVADNFGYMLGRPCVLVRLNRIIDWTANTEKNYTLSKAFKDANISMDELPKNHVPDLKDIPKYIWIKCFGEHTVDKALIGDLKYFPHRDNTGAGSLTRPPLTIPFSFFPYRSQKGYLDPFIMVQFLNPVPGYLLQVRCRAYNQNIMIDRKEGLGSVRFELLVDTNAP